MNKRTFGAALVLLFFCRAQARPNFGAMRGDELEYLFEESFESNPEPTTDATASSTSQPTTTAASQPVVETEEERIARRRLQLKRDMDARRAQIRRQVTKALNLNGKEMPSVEEEFGSKLDAGIGETIQFFPPNSPQPSQPILRKVLHIQDLRPNNQSNQIQLQWFNRIINSNNTSVYRSLFDKVIRAAQKVARESSEDAAAYDDDGFGGNSDYAQKHRSIYPDCGSADPEGFSALESSGPGQYTPMYFALDSLKPSAGFETKALNGNLKLFKIGGKSHPQAATATAAEDEDFPDLATKYRVTIWINKRKSDGKHRLYLVDDALIDASSEGEWVTFNILAAVRSWIRQPETNNGILIEVENTSGGTHMSADKVFQMMDCDSGLNASKLFPSYVWSALSEEVDNADNDSSSFGVHSLNTKHFPVLDISSIETEVTTTVKPFANNSNNSLDNDVIDNGAHEVTSAEEDPQDAFPVLTNQIRRDQELSLLDSNQSSLASPAGEVPNRLKKMVVKSYLKLPGGAGSNSSQQLQRRMARKYRNRLPKLNIQNHMEQAQQQHQQRKRNRRRHLHSQQHLAGHFKIHNPRIVMTKDQLIGALAESINEEQASLDQRKFLMKQIIYRGGPTTTLTTTPRPNH